MDNNFAKRAKWFFNSPNLCFAVNSRLLVSKIFASWAFQLVNCYFLTFFSMKLHLQLASVCAGNLVNWIVWSKQKINWQLSHVPPLQVESVGRKMTKKCCNLNGTKVTVICNLCSDPCVFCWPTIKYTFDMESIVAAHLEGDLSVVALSSRKILPKLPVKDSFSATDQFNSMSRFLPYSNILTTLDNTNMCWPQEIQQNALKL